MREKSLITYDNQARAKQSKNDNFMPSLTQGGTETKDLLFSAST